MPKEIPLTNSELKAIVDDEHFDKVCNRKWYLVTNHNINYACTCIHNTSRYMHHFIFGRRKMFDHKDGDGLNNQTSNVRLTNHSMNGANRKKQKGTFYSKYKGVTFDKRRNKWIAGLQCCGVHYALGYHLAEKDAAIAYNNGALKHFGEHALINVIDV